MDKQQAKNIIKETFENPFNKGRFTSFIKNLLKIIEEETFIYRGQFIPDAYKPYIESLERIGKYSDGEHKIDILAIKLERETSLERARTMQRNFIAWYLNGSRGGEMKDAALAAFIAPDEADWRFSLVKMDYKFEKSETGRMKVKQEFTPARRWSFLVGANEKSHTAQSRLVGILTNDEESPTLAELEEAFNIETVTKEFFIKYRDLFIRTKEALDKVVEKDERIQKDFKDNGVDTVNFAKKLLGQIVFLYFLQKKGWFGVGRDDRWSTGSKIFLRELFEKKHGNYTNFFNDILEPLFYEALRIGDERKQDDYYYSRFNCKIPFLNGGLFDPIGNYDWVHTDVILPNELFSNTQRTKEGDDSDGILDAFDRYNFTVCEDEPLEKEVAIDPELLGKAYEKFNAIRPDNFEEYKKAIKSGKKGDETKFNKQFGVYYTPREIVHYMCQQSLINYLSTELEGKVKKEAIEFFILEGEKYIEHLKIAKEKNEKNENYQGDYKEKEHFIELKKHANEIDNSLSKIKVCDPAVGSGAFPVGMMTEIVKARMFLVETGCLEEIYINSHQEKVKRFPYNYKRDCIENSLYGVDIDPGAVEIAKLRLWLSLVVDEDDIKNIKPLPNLDYKIVCGNSLIGLPDIAMKDIQLESEIERLKIEYFSKTNPTDKRKLKNQIEQTFKKLVQSAKGFSSDISDIDFDFKIHFSEVFHQKEIHKEWKVYNVTWVTHNSRVSERMVEYGVRTGEPVVLDEASRSIIAEAIAEKIQEKQYRVLAVNVLADHVHCVVVCEEDDGADIVQQLKGYSSHQHNRLLQLSVQDEGRQNKLWAKGSSQTLIESGEHLTNAVEYVQNNHLKHNISGIGSSLHHRQLKQSVVEYDRAFAPVIQTGGFDVVIANPPYGAELLEVQKKYLKKRHEHIVERIRNTFLYFLGEAYNQSSKNGVVCFILPNELLFQIYMTKARKFFLENSQILFAINLGEDVFEAIVPTCVICIMKVQQNDYLIPVADLREATLEELPRLLVTNNFPVTTNRKILSAPNYIFSFDKSIAELINRLSSNFQRFDTFCDDVANGISTSCDEVYIVSDKFAKENYLEKDFLKECIRGVQFNRFYCPTQTHEYVLYITDKFDPNKGKNIYQYLFKNKELLVRKSVEKKQGKREWHVLFRSRYEDLFLKPKILIRQTGDKIIAAIDNKTGYYCIDSVNVAQVRLSYYTYSLYFIGLLNSRLMVFYYQEISQEKGRVLAQVKPQRIRSLPISIGTLQHREQITKLVDRILVAKRSNPAADTSELERQIDRLVYDLYGLTEEEIAIVEGRGNAQL